jgi:hypothetical protein
LQSDFPRKIDSFRDLRNFSESPYSISESIEIKINDNGDFGYIFLQNDPISETISISGFNETEDESPDVGYFYVEYADVEDPFPTGFIFFNKDDVGLLVEIEYDSYGNRVKAEDINKIQSAIIAIEREMGEGVSLEYENIKTLLSFLKAQFNSLSGHNHNGINSPKIEFENILSGSIYNRHINENAEIDQDKIKEKILDDDFSGNPENIKENLSQIVTQIKKIIGLSVWDEIPNYNLEDIGSMGGGFNWVEVSSNTTMENRKGYVANNISKVVLTLPQESNFGEVFGVSGKGAGGWKIQCNPGQRIHHVSVSSIEGGYVESSEFNSHIEIMCITNNTDFKVINVVGKCDIQNF